MINGDAALGRDLDGSDDAPPVLNEAHMEGAAVLRVPLVVEIGVGPNWLDAKA